MYLVLAVVHLLRLAPYTCTTMHKEHAALLPEVRPSIELASGCEIQTIWAIRQLLGLDFRNQAPFCVFSALQSRWSVAMLIVKLEHVFTARIRCTTNGLPRFLLEASLIMVLRLRCTNECRQAKPQNVAPPEAFLRLLRPTVPRLEREGICASLLIPRGKGGFEVVGVQNSDRSHLNRFDIL